MWLKLHLWCLYCYLYINFQSCPLVQQLLHVTMQVLQLGTRKKDSYSPFFAIWSIRAKRQKQKERMTKRVQLQSPSTPLATNSWPNHAIYVCTRRYQTKNDKRAKAKRTTENNNEMKKGKWQTERMTKSLLSNSPILSFVHFVIRAFGYRLFCFRSLFVIRR